MKKCRLYKGSKTISLENKAFAGGGEGNLFHIIEPHSKFKRQIAKLYHPHKLTLVRQEKLRYLIENPPCEFNKNENPPSIVWINDLLTNEYGNIIGFTMPFVKGEKLELLSTLRLPKSAATEWARFDFKHQDSLKNRMRLCFNIAVSLLKIHSGSKYVLVDLKPDNIIVQPSGVVSFVDLDSVEVVLNGNSLYDAPVATPEYTAPEFYRKLDYDPTARESWDMFSAAVIFYKLLFGIHPFAAGNLSPFDHCVSLEQKIAAGLYVHNPEKFQYFSIIPPPHNNFESIDIELKNLFNRTFIDGHKNPESRPTAEDFCIALMEAIGDAKLNTAFGHLTITLTEPVNITRVSAAQIFDVPEYDVEIAKMKIIPEILQKDYNKIKNLNFNVTTPRPEDLVVLKKAQLKNIGWFLFALSIVLFNFGGRKVSRFFSNILEAVAELIDDILNFTGLPDGKGFVIIILIATTVLFFILLSRLGKIVQFFLSRDYLRKLNIKRKLKNSYAALKTLINKIEEPLKIQNQIDFSDTICEVEMLNQNKIAEMKAEINKSDSDILTLIKEETSEITTVYRTYFTEAYRLISGLHPLPVNDLKEIINIIGKNRHNSLWSTTLKSFDMLINDYKNKHRAIKSKYNLAYNNLIKSTEERLKNGLKEITTTEEAIHNKLLEKTQQIIPVNKLEILYSEIIDKGKEIENLEYEKARYQTVTLKKFMKLK